MKLFSSILSPRVWRAGLVCALSAGGLCAAHGQQGFTHASVGKDFKLPSYWPATNGTLRLKSLLTGATATPITNGVYFLTQPRVEFYKLDGSNLDWSAVSPTATMDMSGPDPVAWGVEKVFMRSADDRLYARGVGFLWQQSNSVLILSNKTFTWIDTTAPPKFPTASNLNPTNTMKIPLAMSLLITARLTAAEMEVPPPRPGMKIFADMSIVYLSNNMALYTNHVLVIDPPKKPEDPETRMTCEWATVKRGATNSVEEVAAYGRVAVDQGDKHGRGNFGLYTATNEVVVLVGTFDPANTNWLRPYIYNSQGTNEGDYLVYNRRDDTITTYNVRTDVNPTALQNNPTNNAPKPDPKAVPNPAPK